MTPEPKEERDLSLYHIERQLSDLIALRDEDISEEERAVIDAQIEEYVRGQVRKVTNIRAFLLHCDFMENGHRAEADRQMSMAHEWRDRREQVKAYVVKTMQEFGEKKLIAPTGQLQVKGNGGLQPLVIDDPTVLPKQCFVAKVEMPYPTWLRIVEACEWSEIPMEGVVVKSEIDNKAVRAALPCDGAHLEPRGAHLEIK